MAANAIAHGITVTCGAMTEPYLDNLPHPDQALWYLFHGANVGDALLRSERLLKWRIINIGDPLYRPFPKPADLVERLKPAIVFALLPKITLGGATSLAMIALSHAASGPMNLSVRSERPDLVSVPQSVTIPDATNGVKFAIHTLDVAAESTTVRIYVTAKDLQKSNTLVLFSLLESLNITPQKVKENSPALGTVILRAALAGRVRVNLKSSNSAIASTPAEIETSERQSTLTFQITTHAVTSESSVVISASYAGMVRNASLTVVP